jgi:hypothetical protein
MAVAAAQRGRADKAAKDRLLKSLAQDSRNSTVKMSSNQALHQPGVSAQMSLAGPVSFENPQALQVVAEPESGLKKRKALKGKIPAEIRRSASSPHIRGLASSDSSALSPTTDKRRNKLGYHRTSVACGMSSVWEQFWFVKPCD